MKEDHEPGRCYACDKDTDVRWKNLYTIGSEGTWLCLPCELKVVNMLRDMSIAATRAKVRRIKADKLNRLKEGLCLQKKNVR